MKCLTLVMLIALSSAMVHCETAAAEGDTIGTTVTSDREPGDFADPKNMKYELNATHTFDGGVILGGSFQYNERAFSDRQRENLEGTLGYRVPLNKAFSLNASAGAGEHWRQNPSATFPYYVLRIGADLDLSQSVTWNVISFRYRDAFDPGEHYNTPQLATGVTYNISKQSSVSAKIMHNWRDGSPSSTGIALGFRQKF